jgi:hypothetical protein
MRRKRKNGNRKDERAREWAAHKEERFRALETESKKRKSQGMEKE